MSAEVLALGALAVSYAAGAVLAWLTSPWWAAVALTVLLAPIALACFGMAWRESQRA